ncbi:MAG TPA: AI-2E family transporter, partial [Candidatus Nitrosotenuis sp.]|nr:AI-2E family transporter [Candidatus Nitrosotenuis sp.]
MPIWLRITLWLVLWLLLIVGALWLIVHIKATLMIFAVAFLISYLLNPAVTAMEGRRLGPIRRVPRVVAVIVLYAVLGSLLIAVGAIVVPLVVDQVSSLAERAPSLAATIQSKILSARDTYLQKVPPNVRANIETSLASSAETIGTWLKVVFSYMGRFLASTFSSAFIFLTAMLLAFYMLLSWKRLAAGTLAAVPRIYRDEARDLMAKMHQIFGGYLRATIITSAVCGLSTLVLLLGLRWLTGRANPYILIISITATLCYPIPLVNALVPPLLGGILAYLPENNTAYALMVAGVIALTNIVVDRTLSPKLMSEAIGVSPLFVMFAAFAGGELMGVWGMLLGIPLAAMAKALLAWVHGRFLVAPEMLGEPRPVQGMPRQGSSAASLRGGPGLAPSRAPGES